MGRNSEAIPHLEEMIRLRPDFYAGYYTLGKAEAGDGKIEPALQNFSEAIHFKHDYAEAYYSRGVTFLKIGAPQAAEPDLRAALKYGLSVQFSADAYNALGVIFGQRNEDKDAAEQFEQAVRLQPSSVNAQRNLALALIHQGRTQEAIVRLTQAVPATQGNAQLRKMLEDLRAQSQTR